MNEILKTSSTKRSIAKQKVELCSFPLNKKFCVFSTLKEYLCRTKDLRETNGETTSRKPHRKVTEDYANPNLILAVT